MSNKTVNIRFIKDSPNDGKTMVLQGVEFKKGVATVEPCQVNLYKSYYACEEVAVANKDSKSRK